MSDIFFSYAREDAAKARRIVAALTTAGFEVWWDEHLPTHRPFHAVIEERLRASRVVVVLWSRAALASQWVQAEADLGHTLGKLVQASADGVLPSIPFNLIQCAKLEHWNGRPDHPEWLKLLEGVATICGRPIPSPIPGRYRPAFMLRWIKPMPVVICIAALLAGVAVYWTTAVAPVADNPSTAIQSPQPDSNNTVAVLSFENFSTGSDASLDNFVRGLANQIVGVMSDSALRVISTANSQEFRGGSSATAAARIRAGFVLDGSVSREGDLLRVRANVIDPYAMVTLWSNEYLRAAEQSNAMQEQVAAHVADVLQCALVSRRPSEGDIDAASLSTFMRACETAQRFDQAPESMYEAARQVTGQAPGFSRGWSLLAMASALGSSNVSVERAEQLHAQAQAAANTALSLDPLNAEAYLALSLVQRRNDWLARQDLIARALQLEPNSAYANWFQGILLAEVGRISEALTFLGRAAALDPLSPSIKSSMIPLLSVQGRHLEARELAQQLTRVWPDSPSVWYNRFNNAMFSLRDWDLALSILDSVDTSPIRMEQTMREGWRTYILAARSGSVSAAKAAVANLADLAQAGQLEMPRAISAATLVNELDTAFRLAETYHASSRSLRVPEPIGGAARYFLFTMPGARMRQDVRFIALASSSGLLQYWNDTGKWPDFCGDPTLPYDCRAEATKLLT